MVHTKHAHVSMYNNTLYAQSKNTRGIAVDILKSHWEAMVAAGPTKHPDCPLSLVPVIVQSIHRFRQPSFPYLPRVGERLISTSDVDRNHIPTTVGMLKDSLQTP